MASSQGGDEPTAGRVRSTSSPLSRKHTEAGLDCSTQEGSSGETHKGILGRLEGL